MGRLTLQRRVSYGVLWISEHSACSAGSGTVQRHYEGQILKRQFDHRHGRGALLGMACGDALGTTLEFQCIDAAPFPTLLTGPHTHITGGGPFNLMAGQVTDDTQLACCLAQSLRAYPDFNPRDLANRYCEWSRHAFDIGSTTIGSLNRVRNSEVPFHGGRDHWLSTNRRAAGNGSLMRTTPIGVALGADQAKCRTVSLADSAITHFDPRCQLACASFNAAVAEAVYGKASDTQQVFDAALDELPLAAAELRGQYPTYRKEIDLAQFDMACDLTLAMGDDPELYPPHLDGFGRAQGFVRVAYRLAFWELLHAPSLKVGLIDAVNRGGDADTNGAIVGGLLGAYYGADELPQEWQSLVLNALQNQNSGPWRDDYHPKQLMALLDQISA
ncbi:MAG TPA: ADP-ribosylglycohydrolase family protein [Myxococcales bacterium]|nr:ADP-ribosylglycohydrolase family protein [Myxococcales bacterium]